MNRLAPWILAIGLVSSASMIFGQEDQTGHKRGERGVAVSRTEAKLEEEEARLTRWKWANFVVLAGAIAYLAAKQGGPFFAARSKHILKDMVEAGAVRKEAEERAAAVDRRLANLAAEVAPVKAESVAERQAERQRLRLNRESERAKMQAHAQLEIESAGKTARQELKRYAAHLAVELAEQKLRVGMTGEIQDELVGGFVRDLGSPSSLAGSN